MLGIRGRNGIPQPRCILRGTHQAIRGIPSGIPLGANRLAENEFLDRHAGKSRQSLDLAMLLRFDFNSESIHTMKIVNFDDFVKVELPSSSPRPDLAKSPHLGYAMPC